MAATAPGLTARNGLVAEDVERILPVLGIDAPIGEEFECVLPAAPGGGRALVDFESLRYRTLYLGGVEWLSLAEVFASRTAGRSVGFKVNSGGPDVRAARWWDRLRMTAGLIEVDVQELQVPEHASRGARLVADGFALAWALNSLHHDREPMMFSKRFASEWTGVSYDAAGRVIGELQGLDVVRVAGHARAGRFYAPLYLPAFEPMPSGLARSGLLDA